MNNQLQYNSKTSNKTFAYPEEEELKLKNKENTNKGKIISYKNDSVVYDYLTLIKKYNANDIQYIAQTTKPRFGFSKTYNSFTDNNPQMFGSPTATTIGAGNVNVSSHYFLFYKINIGVTEKLDFGGGFTLIPQVEDTSVRNANGQLLNFSLKYKIRDTRHIDWVIGINTFRIPKNLMGIAFSQSPKLIHYAYLAVNADYSALNFSASIGQPFLGTVSNKYTNTGYGINYIFTMAGALKLSEQISIVAENWWLNGIANVPGVVNTNRRGVPDFPLIGGRYYSNTYGAGVGIGNFFIKGVKPFSAFYLDGYYYF